MTVKEAPARADLAATDDIGWAVRLLAATPTHEHRDPELLHRWARTADAFGAALAPVECRARIVERDGGLELGLLARYTSRPPTSSCTPTPSTSRNGSSTPVAGAPGTRPAPCGRPPSPTRRCTSTFTTGPGRPR